MASAGPAAALPSSSKSSSTMASPASSSTTTTAATTASVVASKKLASANGSATRPKSQLEGKTTPAASLESNTPDKHAHDRTLFLMANFVGCVASVTVKSGEVFTGIFSGASLESIDTQISLKMTKKISGGTSNKPNGAEVDASHNEYVGVGADHAMAFDLKDIADIHVPNVSTDKAVTRAVNGASSSSFRTDTEISGNVTAREKELQQWESSDPVASGLTLNGSAGGGWDQFETNERLYGVKTDYDENIYTTSIDRSSASYRQRAAAAEEIARRIEGSTTSDAHVAEERGVVDDEGGDGLDEEERYSGVRRDFPVLPTSSANRYTPPARRPPTSTPTVSGAPVDPAIISSQIAKPEQSPQKPATASAETEGSKEARAAPPTINNEKKEAATELKKTTATTKPLTEQKEIDRPIAKPTIPSAAPPTVRQRLNATETVEKDVLGAFKTFAAGEKQKTQERRVMSARVEKEMKLNDLKIFAANFKLKSEVPKDMLGILANKKDKQDEILEKSKRSIKEQLQVQQQVGQQQITKALEMSPSKRAVSAASTEASKGSVPADGSTQRTPSAARVDATSNVGSVTTPTSSSERRPGRENQPGGRNNNRQFPNQYATPNNARVPGNLGKNLLAMQNQRGRDFAQPAPGQDPRMMQNMPMQVNADMMRASLGPGAVPPHPNRLNVDAMEFRPNPAAMTFMPSAAAPPPASPVSAKKPQNQQPPTESIFKSTRPNGEEKKSLKENFNPIKRLKKYAVDNKQEFPSNAGIQQAYRTPPTWDVPRGNEEKSYTTMFDQYSSSRQSTSPANGSVQNEQPVPFPNQAQQAPPTVMPHNPRFQPGHPMPSREPSYDGNHHAMHQTPSNNSVLPSPRFQSPMVPPQGQMYLPPMQQPYGQPMAQYVGPANQMYMRSIQGNQYPPQGVPMAPPMMQNPSGGMMNLPVQGHVPIYAGSPGPMYAPVGPQASGAPANFYSPRAQMMMTQNSQPGQQQPMVFVPQQPGQPVYAQQPHGQMPQHMRGGMPMQHQASYGSSPRMQNHYPTQPRGMPPPNQFVQPQMPHAAAGMPQTHAMHGSEEMK